MFVRRGNRWHRLYDNIAEQTWTDKTYNASDYIFNESTAIFDNREYVEQHGMSQVILPRPDNELATSGYVKTGYVANGYVAK